MNLLNSLLQSSLAKKQQDHLLRRKNTINSKVNFFHNDYLGLSNNAKMLEQIKYVEQIGAKSSAAVEYNSSLQHLSNAMSTIKKTENCLIFPSGWQANVSAIFALLSNKDITNNYRFICDKDVHHSIYFAFQSAGMIPLRFKNCDLMDLENKLLSSSKPAIVVTQTIFGMSGKETDLSTLKQLRAKHNFLLYIDEAHSVGLRGRNGLGLTADDADIIMGTFSKSFGSQGGYICSNQIIIDYLLNVASGFVYSTALSFAICQAALFATTLIPKLQNEVEKMHTLKDNFCDFLIQCNLASESSKTHIVPIYIPEDKIYDVYQFLLSQNIASAMIRYPSVPKGKSMLRVCFNILHDEADIEVFKKALIQISDIFNLRDQKQNCNI